jgi:predicted regulator of Ras-like GTPase activity (Roadblock/LC7/MglB family)
LLTRNGALLAYSGFDGKDAKIIAAMASGIFAAHQSVRSSSSVIGSGELNIVLLDAEV